MKLSVIGPGAQLLPTPRHGRWRPQRRDGPRILQQLANRIYQLQPLRRPREPLLGILSFGRSYVTSPDTLFYGVYEVDIALVSGPSSGCCSKPPATKGFTVSLLLLEAILLVLNCPAVLSFGVRRALALRFIGAADQVDDKAIERIFDAPSRIAVSDSRILITSAYSQHQTPRWFEIHSAPIRVLEDVHDVLRDVLGESTFLLFTFLWPEFDDDVRHQIPPTCRCTVRRSRVPSNRRPCLPAFPGWLCGSSRPWATRRANVSRRA